VPKLKATKPSAPKRIAKQMGKLYQPKDSGKVGKITIAKRMKTRKKP